MDSYSLTAGTETALTERLDLTVDLGGRYARSESDQGVARTYDPPLIVQSPVTSSDSYDSWGFVGSLRPSTVASAPRAHCFSPTTCSR